MLEVVRATLRTVSRSGHSHAESMWACPTALMRCAEALAGAARTPARWARAAGGEDAGGGGAGGGRRAGYVGEVDGVQGGAEGAQDLVPAGVVGGELRHQLVEHVEVLDQLPDLGLEEGEVHPGEAVEGLVAAGAQVALVGGAVVDEDRVGGGLDVPFDPLAALGAVGHAHPVVVRVEGLDLAAVGAVDQALALEAGHHPVEAEVEDGLHGPPGPSVGDGSGDLEPGGAPGRAPCVAGRAGLVGRGQTLGDGDGLARGVPPLDGQRERAGVDGGPDAFVEHPAEAVLGDAAVVMHDSCSCSRRWWSVGTEGLRAGRTVRLTA